MVIWGTVYCCFNPIKHRLGGCYTSTTWLFQSPITLGPITPSSHGSRFTRYCCWLPCTVPGRQTRDHPMKEPGMRSDVVLRATKHGKTIGKSYCWEVFSGTKPSGDGIWFKTRISGYHGVYPSGNQTWHCKLPYKWKVHSWKNNKTLFVVDFPASHVWWHRRV